MNIKWIGAALVIAGCGGWGLLLAAGYRKQETLLRRLGSILRLMQWELRYRLTALPDLCRFAAKDCGGELRRIFMELAEELDRNARSDVTGCMSLVLKRHDNLPPKVRRILRQLGKILGKFDLEGQLEGIGRVIQECDMELQGLKKDRDIRLKSYQTLALCAGFALVILFI